MPLLIGADLARAEPGFLQFALMWHINRGSNAAICTIDKLEFYDDGPPDMNPTNPHSLTCLRDISKSLYVTTLHDTAIFFENSVGS